MQPERRKDPRAYRLHYCVICGHVEWVPKDAELAAGYRCPLCGADRRAMQLLPLPARQRVVFDELAGGVVRARKAPPFRTEYEHASYLLCHPQGVLLFDAPPLCTDEAVAFVRCLGTPRWLVVSHSHFVGTAALWARALDVPVWMGAGEQPLDGNHLDPDERVTAAREVAPGLEVIPVPGHTPGSLAVAWRDRRVVCAGDAVCVWPVGGGLAQVSLPQTPPIVPALRALLESGPELLLCCTGAIVEGAAAVARAVLDAERPCAYPWRGEEGGVRAQVVDERRVRSLG